MDVCSGPETTCTDPPADANCPDLDAGVSRVFSSEVFGCGDDATISVPDLPVSVTYSYGLWDQVRIEAETLTLVSDYTIV